MRETYVLSIVQRAQGKTEGSELSGEFHRFLLIAIYILECGVAEHILVDFRLGCGHVEKSVRRLTLRSEI